MRVIFILMKNLKDKTTDIRRAQILEAAIKVFAEKGFHVATIKDVMTEVGVAE